jgi:ParB family chromosome partitioning protein
VGLETIPAYIRIANDQESLEMALVENIQREDLDPIEIALSYQRLIEEIELTQEKLSDRVGKKRSTITNYLRLLRLDPIIQTGMRDGFITMGHGRALVNIEKRADQLDIYEQIIEHGLSVRQTEELVRKYHDSGQIPKKSGNTKSDKSLFILNNEIALSHYLETDVALNTQDNEKGKMTITFRSKEELQRIIKLITGE